MNRFSLALIVVFAAWSCLGAVEAQVPASDTRALAWMPPSGARLQGTAWQLGTFRSKAVEAEVGYYYYLPPRYESDKDKRYPVIYWLHGLNGSPASAGAGAMSNLTRASL